MASSSKPTGLIATKGVEFLSFVTPNGYKVSWVLEELKEAYGIDVTSQTIDITSRVQKEPWYLKISPIGKIPALVDHDNGGLALWESSIIIIYLLNKYDTKRLLSYPPGTPEGFEFVNWLEYTSSDLAPAHGNAGDYYRLLPERDAFATQREVGELERCYGVLNTRLENRDYMVGPDKGRFTAIDIAVWCYINYSGLAGVGLDISKWPNLQRHYQKIAAEKKSTIEKAFTVPTTAIGVNEKLKAKYDSDEALRAKEDGLREVLLEGRKKYGYQYRAN